jgi:hypothetical protein
VWLKILFLLIYHAKDSRGSGVQPPADVLGRIADTLGTSVDFLVNGNTTEKAQDAELLKQFKAVEKMDENDQNTIKSLIDAFITKGKLKQMVL